MTETVDYLEPLPIDCPPNSASDQPLDNVWRFVDAARKCVADLVPTDFASHAALALPVGDATECDARSCSLWSDAKVKKAGKLPKLKLKNMVQLNIPAGNGRWTANDKRGHIHFWIYQGCNMCAHATHFVVKHA